MTINRLTAAAADAEPATLLWALAAALLAVALWGAWAEHRRRRRPNLDRVGWVPWDLVQILGFLGAFVAAALAIQM